MIEIGDSSGESSVQLTRLSGLYSNPRAGNFNCRHQGILIVADQSPFSNATFSKRFPSPIFATN